MSLTRTYQCPGCGTLIPTKRDPSKYLTCSNPGCNIRGLISKHSVSTPMNVAQKTRAKKKELATKQENKEGDGPHTQGDQITGGEMTEEKDKKEKEDQGGKDYKCGACNAEFDKPHAYCPSCGAGLSWAS